MPKTKTRTPVPRIPFTRGQGKTYQSIKGLYNAKKHPDFLSDEVLSQIRYARICNGRVQICGKFRIWVYADGYFDTLDTFNKYQMSLKKGLRNDIKKDITNIRICNGRVQAQYNHNPYWVYLKIARDVNDPFNKSQSIPLVLSALGVASLIAGLLKIWSEMDIQKDSKKSTKKVVKSK